jgi:exoenzyme U
MDAWILELSGIDPRGFADSPGEPARALKAPRSQPGSSPAGEAVGTGPSTIDPSVNKAAANPAVWTNAVGKALTKDGPGKPGARIAAPVPTGPATICKGAGGKEISVAKGADGRVAFTRDPPPIKEITFSGGGGKGTALPGAVWALSKSGALASAKELHGASVGSMTAAMLAAGMTPGDFQEMNDTTNFDKVIHDDHIGLFNHDGKAMEALIRDKMKSALNKQIAAFAEDAMAKGTKIDPATQKTLDEMSAKFASGKGPTFGDLRILSKIIPAIKEVVISGTLIGASPAPKPGGKPPEISDRKPELKIFSADTEPDLEVACAVHASAALPGVFDPVDLKLQDGSTARFEDGGVLNNAPSSDTTGTDRDVDPVPDEGKMTFLFEDDAARSVISDTVAPTRSRFGDMVSGAENSAAEYAKNKTLAEHPEDFVVVPLTFERTNGKKEDYTGLKGTLAFNMNKEDAIRLQGMTEKATENFVKIKGQKETRSFASDAQMLNAIPREDLVTMAGSDYPGAKQTLAFRDAVVAQVATLEGLAARPTTPPNPRIAELLAEMNGLALGDQDRVAFIGRALNRSGKLDKLLASLKDKTGKPSTGLDAVDAGIAVNEVILARATARTILADTLYPKLVREGTEGVEGKLLKQMETMLRSARSRRDINRALTIGIDYYSDKFDAFGALRKHLQPTH